jgi:hypothetical protein
LEKLFCEQNTQQYNTSFFKGLPGIGCFLLSLIEPGKWSLVIPAISHNATIEPLKGNNADKHSKQLELPGINKWFAIKNFKQTFSLLEKEFPVDVDDFLRTSPLCPVNSFINFVQQLNKSKLQQDRAAELNELFGLEHFNVCVKQSIDDSCFPDEQVYHRKVQFVLQLSEENLLKLKLKMADHLWIICQEDQIDLNMPLTSPILQHLVVRYGAKTLFLRVNKFNELESGPVFTLKLPLDLFQEPTEVKTALQKAMQFFSPGNAETLETLKQTCEIAADQDWQGVVRKAVLDKIRSLLLSDFLDFADA